MRRPHGRFARGAETIEVALALPLVVIVIFCGFEFGWAMVRTTQLDHAARIGAREASMSGTTAADVQDRAQDALQKAGIQGATVTVTPSDLSSAQPGTVVKVEIEVSYANVKLLGLGRLMPMPSTIRGSASMVREPDA